MKKTIKDPRNRYYVLPTKISSLNGKLPKNIKNPDALLNKNEEICEIAPKNNREIAYIILDFGQELNGGVEIDVCDTIKKNTKIRLRFGESLTEVMTDPNNDHAIHDILLNLPNLGKQEFGNTGFRFVRIDNIDPVNCLKLRQVNAISLQHNYDYKGSFRCSDELLNKIWDVGARTVHLCCQEYILDGIKRDRLPWMGDVHPQIPVIATVFGEIDIVPKTIKYLSQVFPPNKWMNNNSSYTLWWIIGIWDWYVYTGDLEFLKDTLTYLTAVIKHLENHITDNWLEKLGETRFLDWALACEDDKVALHQGLQLLLAIAFESASKIYSAVNNPKMTRKCSDISIELKNSIEITCKNKQVRALQALTGTPNAKTIVNDFLMKDLGINISPWFGYYILQAKAEAKDYEGCIDFIRQYWGGMIELGATTYWEHFDQRWLENAARIDEYAEDGRINVHTEYGEKCFKGTRHSLCHGWSAGPTAWLSQHVLGVKIIEPGYKKVVVQPNLANLEWAEGTVPTPLGPIHLKHTKAKYGIINTEHGCPPEIELVFEGTRTF